MGSIQIWGKTAAEWTSDNDTLLDRQPGYETDTRKLKIGDGVTAWNALDYIEGSGGTADYSTITGDFADSASGVSYVQSEINTVIRDQGNYDASSNLFPTTGGSGTAGAIEKGNQFTISVNGTLGGTAVTAPYSIIRALVDTPGQTASNWFVEDRATPAPAPSNLPRSTSITSSATPTINTNLYDCVSITALATAITSFTTNLSGTPVNFQPLIIRIKDNGVARAITWGASFEAVGESLPTTTVINKRLTVAFLYDSVSTKWGCVGVKQES